MQLWYIIKYKYFCKEKNKKLPGKYCKENFHMLYLMRQDLTLILIVLSEISHVTIKQENPPVVAATGGFFFTLEL